MKNKAWIFIWVKDENKINVLLNEGWELVVVYEKHWGKNHLLKRKENAKKNS